MQKVQKVNVQDKGGFSPFIVRYVLNRWKRFCCFIEVSYYSMLRFLFRKSFTAISIPCPLDGCNNRIASGLFSIGAVSIDQVLDAVFKSVGRHLDAQHDIKNFIGLAWEYGDKKYKIFIGSPEKQKEVKK